ncbi:hypothetical protein M3Y99_00317400 [Aphelenchoides fujianensis]|nr:hypothetical protein M3Y99_00317400 [Aphelenchoides fujianensis]
MFADRADLPAEMEVDEVGSVQEAMDDEEIVLPPPDRPLAGIVAEEYRNVDPKLYFPSFKKGGILRFSKLFGVHPKTLRQNMIWWPSRTFFKKVAQRSEPEPKELKLNVGPIPKREECLPNQMDLLLASEAELEAMRNPPVEEDEEPPAWRFGPAQIWYDRLGLPEKPKRFDYGFHVSKQAKIPSLAKKPVVTERPSDDELLPVDLMRWEDEIIFDDTQVKSKVGLVFAISFHEHLRGPTTSHSIFPTDNYDLESTRWEDDIIFDPDNMPAIPQPKVLTIEYEDDPRVFGMPEDVPGDGTREDAHRNADRKDHQFTKKSKMILGQVQRRQKQEEEEQLESTVADKDPFNLSNDEYYYPKNVQRSIGSGAAIQHATPAQNIHRAFFPTSQNHYRLRHFHRLPAARRVMREYTDRETPVRNVVHRMEEAEEYRRQQKLIGGASEIFHMRHLRDLTSLDGKILLPGMASKIRNYYKRKTQNEPEPSCEFGETAFTMVSPFLGNLEPGQCLQAIENNMFRAPIYRHTTPETDFILIRTSEGIFIRECPLLFVAGQECPQYEVPSPNSKRANVFIRDFLLAFIYRLFWESEQQPRRIRMEDIREAFPQHAESSVRKRLKQCSDFKRMGTGPDQNYWIVRTDFRLPSKEEVLAMVTPEMCCAFYSMQAAEQRLKDAGYGEKYFFTPENDDDSDDQITMEDEIKCAPWNTTRAYISAVMKGKCLLDQTGVADPTGCGQGFSYVRVSKPQKEEVPQMPKRLVTGTNADLRKLPLKEAKEICRGYGVREEEINSLSRWEIIDVIRTLSTQAAKSRSDFSGMARFARGNIRMNFDDMRDKYKQYCQGVTDEGSDNGDSDNEDMASKLEKMLDTSKNVQKRGIQLGASLKRVEEQEDEERERLALQRMLQGEADGKPTPKKPGDPNKPDDIVLPSMPTTTTPGVTKKLKICRTIRAPDGTESTRMEVINNQQVIEAYTKIRESQTAEFIKVYAQMDEEYKEPGGQNIPLEDMSMASGELMTCEGTKIKISKKFFAESQKKNELNRTTTSSPAPVRIDLESGDDITSTTFAPEMPSPASTVGSSSARFSRSGGSVRKRGTIDEADYLNFPQKVVHRRRADPRVSMSIILTEIFNDLKQVEGVSALMKPVNPKEVRDYYDVVKNPMDLQQVRNRINECQVVEISLTHIKDQESYLIEIEKAINPLLHENDLVGFCFILQDIVQRCKNVSKSVAFHSKVDARKVPGYYERITNPMDLGTIELKAKNYEYRTVEDFLSDIQLIYENSVTFNGAESSYTLKAREIVECAEKLVADKQAELQELQSRIAAPAASEQPSSDFVMEEMDETTRDTFPHGDYVHTDDQEESSRLEGENTEPETQMDYDESTMDAWEMPGSSGLASSQMFAAGQLSADLALSDSSEDEDVNPKRARLDPEGDLDDAL